MKKFLPIIVTALCAIWVVATFFKSEKSSPQAAGFDIAGFGRLPVLADGRMKPLDTIARTTLLGLQGRQSVAAPGGGNLSPSEWLLDTCFNPAAAGQYRVFEIVNPEVLALVQLSTNDGDGGKRFSAAQLAPHFNDIDREARLAGQLDSKQRNAFQEAVLTLYGKLIAYQQVQYSFISPDAPDFPDLLDALQKARTGGAKMPDSQIAKLGEAAQGMSATGTLLTVPPDASSPQWRKAGDALLASIDSGGIPPALMAYAGLARAWQAGQPAQFNEILHAWRDQVASQSPGGKLSLEWRLNLAEPFYNGIILCVLAFLLGVISWLKWPEVLSRSAFGVMCVAWVLMTVGIALRMVLEGRPPVTNIYSSALGVGWCVVTLCIILEAIYKNALASVAGGLTGFCTLIIAQHLLITNGGDTMEMMRAVLDSNFWLATHVVAITIGYGATFLAGALAILYIIRSVFTRSLDRETAQGLEHMVYGIVCFATLFSFAGTVLGGIWADQAWGRFWGWDPKENGALIIVVWNAIVLHARWGRLVGVRGLMGLVVFGNIVTTWSWFGTNLLGVGLHSYGFTSSGFWTLIIVVAIHALIIVISRLPPKSPVVESKK